MTTLAARRAATTGCLSAAKKYVGALRLHLEVPLDRVERLRVGQAGEDFGQRAITVAQPAEARQRVVSGDLAVTQHDDLVRGFLDEFRHRGRHYDSASRIGSQAAQNVAKCQDSSRVEAAGER